MPPKAKIPAPIDRPLSRAYLREFSGWSTAYPPGLSEPTSLRVMENMMVNRDGSLRIRPGLRHLSFASPGIGVSRDLVGTHEVFFLNDGSRAYLYATRDVDNSIGFRVLTFIGGVPQVRLLSDPSLGFSLPSGADLNFSAQTTYVKYLQIDNKILALSDNGESMRLFNVGSAKSAKKLQSITVPDWTPSHKPAVRQPSKAAIDDPVTNKPFTNSAARTANTLLPPVADYSACSNAFGYFYTFSNEVGESAASQITTGKLRRRYEAWRWDTPNTAAEPSGTETDDPAKVADQLIIYPNADAFAAAKAAGATHFNVYVLLWNDQSVVPVEGVLVGSKEITAGLVFEDCWVRHSPAPIDASRVSVLPTVSNRYNYSNPSRGGQGLVAADRMIVVNDPTDAAVIKWTTNRTGEYTNFTAGRGGGYKTLTYGNLYIPACVKLWQNPESKDTLTILCMGVDGYSSSFYMAPAQVSSQSDVTSFMAFEETTATPGTISPYGCEVLNNALYHPLEGELMKSTASNYNISHKTMTELIANKWAGLVGKNMIVSSQLDNRLYYLVNNPDGQNLEMGCFGNEVWVLDTAPEGGSWSRWLVQGTSLRKIEVDGQVVMSIVKPDGIYCFDPTRTYDEYNDRSDGCVVKTRPIYWRAETNTQGANRAHDAWAHLQQASLTLGNFRGRARWGIRGRNLHGKAFEIAKIVRDDETDPLDDLPWDLTDHLSIREDVMEWRFFAEAVLENGLTQPSQGQLSLVQYRYTPVSVNVGYEYGSVETFEYARNAAVGNNTLSFNGVPQPMVDTGRP